MNKTIDTRAKIRCYLSLVTGLAIFVSGCQTVGPGAATGGAFGTFAGGLTGAAIGAKDGKSTEGALIGALAGGTLGATAGNSVDREIERDRIEFQQAQTQQRLAAVNMAQVLQMSQSGLSKDVIIRQLQTQGIDRRPTTDDLINLKNLGVDDFIIQAMQSAPIAGSGSNLQFAQHPIEVIRQPVIYKSYGPNPYRGYSPRRRHRGPRAGVSVRF